MSILVVEPDEINGPAIVRLLVSEGDDVGVIVPDASAGERWKSIGAYVAVGSAEDADLIERAAQHARSIVLFDAPHGVVAAVTEGARMAGSPHARLLYCSTRNEKTALQFLEASGLEYVLLVLRVRRTGLRRRIKPDTDREIVAEAVNAADDLGGIAHLTVDVQSDRGRLALGLETPIRRG